VRCTKPCAFTFPTAALIISSRAYHAFTLEKPALTATCFPAFAEDVLRETVEG